MATAVFLAHPTRGHLAPARGVVAELVRRGERVIAYTTDRARALVDGTGAETALYPCEHEAFDPTPATAGVFADMARLFATCERIVPPLVADVQRLGAAYLLIDSKSVWGRLVGQLTRLPVVKLSVVFAIPRGRVSARELVPLLAGDAPREALLDGLVDFSHAFGIAARLDRTLGTESTGIVDFLGNPQPRNVVFTSRAFQPDGDAFGDDTLFVGPWIVPRRDDESQFPFEQLDGAPLVYVSLGTTFHDAPELYDACFRAFAQAPWQIVLATGGARVSGAPANFLVRDFVPQLAVLARASACVTHGGMNSVNEALWHAVPMLVVPQRGDQHIVARRVEELGAGLALRDPRRLREDVARLIAEPHFRDAAQRLGHTLRAAGGAVRAADAILAFTREQVATA